ncbi:MAG: hypothetical protein IPO02_13840 [Bacteroidetes bacterium]|nr:hypothetical protein [Bacteroidota bacterium]
MQLIFENHILQTFESPCSAKAGEKEGLMNSYNCGSWTDWWQVSRCICWK